MSSVSESTSDTHASTVATAVMAAAKVELSLILPSLTQALILQRQWVSVRGE